MIIGHLLNSRSTGEVVFQEGTPRSLHVVSISVIERWPAKEVTMFDLHTRGVIS